MTRDPDMDAYYDGTEVGEEDARSDRPERGWRGRSVMWRAGYRRAYNLTMSEH